MSEPSSPQVVVAEISSAAFDGDYLLSLIAAELDDGVRQLNAGFDMAPARRLSLEGLTAACLAAGMAAEKLLQFCRQRLSGVATASLHSDVYLSADGKALQFDLWQRRAPVYPSTTE